MKRVALTLSMVALALCIVACSTESTACNHTETDVVSGRAATCTTDGLTDGTKCKNCCVTVTEQAVIPATGHSYGEWHITTEPSCEVDGEQRRDCENCDYFETQPIAASGHSYETVVSAPTCTEQGYTTYTCDCREHYTSDYVEATGHNYGEWHITTEPSCEVDGEQRRDCKNCDYFETQPIAASGHSYETVVSAPTCTEQGYAKYICHCGDNYMADYQNATSHSWSAWVVIDEPEIGIEGAEQRICLSCGKAETRKIDALPEPDYEVFAHEIGSYHFENKRYEMALKNHFDYAAYISVYTTSRDTTHEDAIIKAFEEHFGFTPTAKVKIEKIGTYLVKDQVQTVFQYSIFDTTYPFLGHDPYEVYHQICTDGSSNWVGFAIYGSNDDDWNELMSDPKVQALKREMFEMFYDVTGYDAEYISEHNDDFCINWISVAGTMRTAEGGLVEILFNYCREKGK